MTGEERKTTANTTYSDLPWNTHVTIQPSTPSFRHTLADFASIQRQGRDLLDEASFLNANLANLTSATPAPRKNRFVSDKIESTLQREREDFSPLTERASPVCD